MRAGIEALQKLQISNVGLLQRASEFPVRSQTKAYSVVIDRMCRYLLKLSKVKGDDVWKMMLWRRVGEIENAIKLMRNKRERAFHTRRLKNLIRSISPE